MSGSSAGGVCTSASQDTVYLLVVVMDTCIRSTSSMWCLPVVLPYTVYLLVASTDTGIRSTVDVVLTL